MRSARFRMASRVFATLLLAWTTADLCGHGMCVHDREPLVPDRPGGAWTARDHLGASTADRLEADACNGPDDCFCCCHCVDVQVRFQIPVVYTVRVCRVLRTPFAPHLAPSPLYHPPLA